MISSSPKEVFLSIRHRFMPGRLPARRRIPGKMRHLPSAFVRGSLMAWLLFFMTSSAWSGWKAVSENLVENADMEIGESAILRVDPNDAVDVVHFLGNPVPGDKSHQGEFCMLLDFQAINTGTRVTAGLIRPISIDPTKTYRVSAEIYTEADMRLSIGGYACGADGIQSKQWQYNLKSAAGSEPEGPMSEWTTYETIIGPENSDAPVRWPTDAATIGMTFWFHKHAKGQKLYLDNIEVEEVVSE